MSCAQCFSGIQAVIASMTLNPEQYGLQEAACGALQSLACLHASSSLVVQEGGVEAIVAAMHAHNHCHGSSSHGLLWAACDALHALIELEPQCLAGFMHSGGVEAIVQAMVNGPREQPGMSSCFALLQHVAKSSPAAHNRICAARTLYGMRQEWISQDAITCTSNTRVKPSMNGQLLLKQTIGQKIKSERSKAK